MTGKGFAVCIGDDIDTDRVIAGRYLRTKDKQVWVEHVFEDLDPSLAGKMNGCVLVAGKNMGCGSSREQAAVALKEAGVKAVVARSFARIFFRNCINVGLPVFECEDIKCSDGDEVSFELETGKITVAGADYSCRPLSPRMVEIIKAGGLVGYWKQRNEK